MNRPGRLIHFLLTSRWLAVALLIAWAVLLPAIAQAQDAPDTAAAAPMAEAAPAAAPAAEATITAADAMFATNNVWMMLSIGLVFLMHLGFASLESGLCRRKNAVNILTKNTAIPMIGVLTYAFIGFNLMYPGEATGWSLSNWFGRGHSAAELASTLPTTFAWCSPM